jgi:formate-dependent nitrite reductase membrane component NrfD
MPWDWLVSLYTWTKSIAAGVYLAALLAVVTGGMAGNDLLWRGVAPAIALVALAATGLILIVDLEHPLRFYMIFTRPQWRSWLVRGAFVIALYALVLLAHLVLEFVTRPGAARSLAWIGAPAAVLTAAYTGYLFAQAKGRDLWQSPLLPPHLVVQALIAGAAVLLPVALLRDPAAGGMLATILTLSCGVHLVFVLAEHTLTHVSAHARLAARALTRGAYAAWFWPSVVLMAAGATAPWWQSMPGSAGVVIAAGSALLGLFAYEHAYVQAGQSVPLA